LALALTVAAIASAWPFKAIAQEHARVSGVAINYSGPVALGPVERISPEGNVVWVHELPINLSNSSDLLSVADYVAVFTTDNRALGRSNWSLEKLDAVYAPGASIALIAGNIQSVDIGIGTAKIGTVSVDLTGLADPINAATLLQAHTFAVAIGKQASAGSPIFANTILAIDGTGTLAIDGTGLQAIDGTGILAIDGTGILAIDGTGILAIDGTGLLAIDGTGVQAIDGTGKPQAIDGTGKPQAIDGTGKPQAIDGTGKPQAIDGTGKPQAIDGTGKPQAIDGTGFLGT